MCLEVVLLCAAISLMWTTACSLLFDAQECHRSEFTRGCRQESGMKSMETARQMDKSMIHDSQLFLETLGWWTADEWWMLWRTSGGERGPTARSIVLRWPVKNSIIPRSHLCLSLPVFFFSLPWTGAASQYNSNNIIVAKWTRALIQSQPCTEIYHTVNSGFQQKFASTLAAV